MKLVIPIIPMGTIRMTQGMVKRIKWRLYEPGDKKVERVKRYLDYKNELSWAARNYHKGTPLDGPIYLSLTFYMPIPDSYSEKKKRALEGQPHTKKPDRDNLEKGVCDAFNKIIWKDDGQVCDGPIRKFYSKDPRIEIEIELIGEGIA